MEEGERASEAKRARVDSAAAGIEGAARRGGDPHALLDPILVAVREAVAADTGQPLESWRYTPPWFDHGNKDPRTDKVLATLLDLRLVGSGAEGLPEAAISRLELAKVSSYYYRAVEFGTPSTQLNLAIGHAGLLLLLEAIYAPAGLELNALSAIDLLQAALYLQVDSVTRQVLPKVAGRLPLPLYPLMLQLPAVCEGCGDDGDDKKFEALREMRDKVVGLFSAPSPEVVQQAVPLLAAFPDEEMKFMLSEDNLNSPTQCYLLQVLCELALVDEGAATGCLPSQSCLLDMSDGELEAAGFYLQARQDLPPGFAAAALLGVVQALGSGPRPRLHKPRELDEGYTEQVLLAWVPCEGAPSEGAVLRAKPWETECGSTWGLELEVVPADTQVPGSEMALRLRKVVEPESDREWEPESDKEWEWDDDYFRGYFGVDYGFRNPAPKPVSQALPQGLSIRAFAFTTEGLRIGRVGPLKQACRVLHGTAFLRRVSGSAFLCADGRRRLLVGVMA